MKKLEISKADNNKTLSHWESRKGGVIYQCMEDIDNIAGIDVACIAAWAVVKGCATPEWGIKQIERGIGDVNCASCLMLEYGYVTQEWVDKLKENQYEKTKNI